MPKPRTSYKHPSQKRTPVPSGQRRMSAMKTPNTPKTKMESNAARKRSTLKASMGVHNLEERALSSLCL